MPTLDRDKLKQELRALDDPMRCAAFAARMALVALPFLAYRAEEKGFCWYWQEEERTIRLLAVLRALQAAWSVFWIKDQLAVANAANTAAYAANAAAALITNAATSPTNAVTDSDAADAAAHAAYAVVNAARAAADAETAVTAAVDAANAYVDAYAYAHVNTGDIAGFVWQELKILKSKKSIIEFLNSSLFLPSTSDLTKKQLISNLFQMLENFDYWAEWLKARYACKFVDVNILEKSVLLPAEIQTQNPAQINTYLKTLRNKHQPLNRVRAIFIGSGDAGKTSLIRTLRGQTVVQGQEPMTPGIDISRFQVGEVQADLWDFGGQVMAHATHQFFLRERCLYVLVLQSRPQLDPNEEARYWLEHVRAFGKDPPVLVVGNKADILQVNLNRNDLQDKYRNISGFYDLSCTGAQGEYRSHFERFQSDFEQQLQNLEICQVQLPPAHFQVLEDLEDLSPRETFLTQAAFSELCTRHGVPASGGLDKDWLLDLFDKLGVIVHFPNIAYLDDYILNPRWLTYGVYTLLYAKQVEQQAGRIAENAVSTILQAEEVADNLGNTLSYHDKAHWITGAMEAFKICYKVESGADTQLIIPAKLPDSRPRVDFDRNGALAFDFDCEGFLPRHLIAGFIVKHHADIDHHVWQSGVQLRNATYGATALVEADPHNRRFSLWVKGEQAARYFAVLYATVREMLDKMPKLPVEEFVRLPGSEDLLNPVRRAAFKQLLVLEQRGIDDYPAQDGSIYSVVELLKIMPKELRTYQAYSVNNDLKSINNDLESDNQTSLVITTSGAVIIAASIGLWLFQDMSIQFSVSMIFGCIIGATWFLGKKFNLFEKLHFWWRQ